MLEKARLLTCLLEAAALSRSMRHLVLCRPEAIEAKCLLVRRLIAQPLKGK